VVGAGGLGCPVLQYLAGAGVGEPTCYIRGGPSLTGPGTVDIFDHDTVSASNLHRQVLHTTERVGMNKAESAAAAMTAWVSRDRYLKLAQADKTG
jgi:adenylyltransferase/sulfurtransferase